MFASSCTFSILYFTSMYNVHLEICNSSINDLIDMEILRNIDVPLVFSLLTLRRYHTVS